jgi:tetratricopeptide (TPR) repeat protein
MLTCGCRALAKLQRQRAALAPLESYGHQPADADCGLTSAGCQASPAPRVDRTSVWDLRQQPSALGLLAPFHRWRRCAQLLPHVLAAADHAEATGLESASLAAVLGRAGTYLHVRRRAEYAAARSLVERAVVLCETSVGPDHIEMASILHSLGLVLRDQADLPGARQQLERALAITEARMGPDHVDVGLILESLSRVLRDQGDLAGSRALLERASTVLEGAVGPGHPWVGRTLGNLGRVLHDQGDLTSARAQLERAVTIYETALGPDHPHLAGTLLYLGLVLHDQGDLAGARAHLKRAHRILVRVLGPQHPTTLGVAHRLEGLDPGLRWPLRQNA